MKKLLNIGLIFILLITANTLLANTENKEITKKEETFNITKSTHYAKAENGDRDEQYFLALELLKNKQALESQKYFIKAAAQGHLTAKMYLALLNINGLTEDELKVNQDLFENLADFNLKNPEIISLNYEMDLSDFYLQATKENLNNALSYLESLNELNNRDAEFALAIIYLNGLAGIDPDKNKALKLMNLSAENGHYQAIDFLDNLEKNTEETVENKVELEKEELANTKAEKTNQ